MRRKDDGSLQYRGRFLRASTSSAEDDSSIVSLQARFSSDFFFLNAPLNFDFILKLAFALHCCALVVTRLFGSTPLAKETLTTPTTLTTLTTTNNRADEAADFGRRRVGPHVVDVRHNFSGVRRPWYPVVHVLHMFFVAISRAVGPAPSELLCFAGLLRLVIQSGWCSSLFCSCGS